MLRDNHLGIVKCDYIRKSPGKTAGFELRSDCGYNQELSEVYP
jgi:hypothetical protein